MSDYSRAVQKLTEQPEGRLPCMWCKVLTLNATLSQYGARCHRCFEAYCSEGVRGGRDGFTQGAPDTDQQREMRKRLKASRPVGQAMASAAEDDAAARDAAKAATARKVREYAKKFGVTLGQSEAIHSRGQQ